MADTSAVVPTEEALAAPESPRAPRNIAEKERPVSTSSPISPASQSLSASINFEELDFNALEAFPSAPSAKSSPAATRSLSPGARPAEISWYVRPPTGGQFGPATGEVIRSWLEEGRVPVDSLVWREGWRDWKVASAAFPQLDAGEDPKPMRPVASRQPSSKTVLTDQPNTSGAMNGQLGLLILLVVVTGLIIVSGMLIWSYAQGPSVAPAPGLVWLPVLSLISRQSLFFGESSVRRGASSDWLAQSAARSRTNA